MISLGANELEPSGAGRTRDADETDAKLMQKHFRTKHERFRSFHHCLTLVLRVLIQAMRVPECLQDRTLAN